MDPSLEPTLPVNTPELLAKWRDDYDWAEVFRYAGQGGNYQGYDAPPNRVPPTSTVANAPFGIDDVACVFGYVDGEHDECDWVVYGILNDGRYFALSQGQRKRGAA